MLIVISTLVSVGFGYLFFRIVRPKSQTGSKSNFYARTFLAWSLFASTSCYRQHFAVSQSLDNIISSLSLELPFVLVAITACYLFGRDR